MNDNPVVIGGSGGSGTRVVAMICHSLGFYMGDLSYAFDSKVFENFFNLWTKNYLLGCDSEKLNDDFNKYLHDFFRGKDYDKWGFKNTRTLFFISYFKSLFNEMKFIHVVRDGRDMVFSQNHRQPRELFDVFFDRAWSQSTVFEDAARFWNETNLISNEIGKKLLNDRYLLIRLEDLCFDKYNTLTKMLKYLDVDGDVDSLAENIITPKTFGRYKTHPELIDMITGYTIEGLKRFGYES